MNTALYKTVFGKDNTPDDEAIAALDNSMKALPESIEQALRLHYGAGKNSQEVADALHQPVNRITTWFKTGVAMLKVFNGVHRQ